MSNYIPESSTTIISGVEGNITLDTNGKLGLEVDLQVS